MTGLEELARGLGFDDSGVARALEFPVVAPHPAPPLDSFDAALRTMTRHGATRAVISQLRQTWESQPLELGLASWDILCTTLFDEGALAAGLVLSARPLWPILPSAGRQGIALEKMSPQALARSLAARGLSGASDDSLTEGVLDHSIGAYEELRRRGAAEVLQKDGTALERTRRFALDLHRARLETLASFYLHYLWKAYDWAPAFDDLCEVLLDCGSHDRLPAALGEDEELAAYAAARASLVEGRAAAYHREHLAIVGNRWFGLRAEVTAKMAPKLRMVEAAIGLVCTDLPIPYAVVDRIADDHPDWRFGARVRAGMHARLQDGREVQCLDDFLERYGSDVELWKGLFDGDYTGVWCGKLVERAIAEVAAAPHLAAAWRGLALLTRFDPAPIEGLIEARLSAQCARALAGK